MNNSYRGQQHEQSRQLEKQQHFAMHHGLSASERLDNLARQKQHEKHQPLGMHHGLSASERLDNLAQNKAEKTIHGGLQDHAKPEQRDKRDKETFDRHSRSGMSSTMGDIIKQQKQKEQSNETKSNATNWQQIMNGTYKGQPRLAETQHEKQVSKPGTDRQVENKPTPDQNRGRPAGTGERIEPLPQNKLADTAEGKKDISGQSEKPRIIEQRHTLMAGRQLDNKEKEERKSVVNNAESGIGFHFGQDKPAPGQMDSWWKMVPADQKQALQDPNTKIAIIALASRPGGSDFNKNLTDKRAENVEHILHEKFGVKAQIQITSLGEKQAANKPENKDDRNDRVVLINISPANKVEQTQQDKIEHLSPKDGVQKIIDLAPHAIKVDKTAAFGHDLVKAGVKIGVDILKNPATLEIGIIKGIAKVTELTGKYTLQDISEAQIKWKFGANFIPAFRNRIDEFTTGVRHSPGPAQESSKYTQLGREIADQIWNNLPTGVQKDLIDLANSHQKGDEFRKQLGQALYECYISKEIQYLNLEK